MSPSHTHAMLIERANLIIQKDGLDQNYSDLPIGLQKIYTNRAKKSEKAITSQSSLGVNMAGGKTIKTNREGLDFYPTQPDAVYSLVKYLEANRSYVFDERLVWESCCGDGAMSKIITEMEHTVISTDIKDYGYKEFDGILNCLEERPKSSHEVEYSVITNPPFNIAEDIIRKLVPENRFVALLLKSTYFHAKERIPLFREHRPSLKLDLTWRLDWTGAGRPTMECSWFIWDKDAQPEQPAYDVLERHRYKEKTSDN